MSTRALQDAKAFVASSDKMLEKNFGAVMTIAKDVQRTLQPFCDDSDKQLKVLYEHVITFASRQLETKLYCKAVEKVTHETLAISLVIFLSTVKKDLLHENFRHKAC